MTVDEFAAVTRRIISKEGFNSFLPIACFPQSRAVKALVGVPDDVDLEEATLNWARKEAANEQEFLVAFKYSEMEFKVIRIHGDQQEHKIFST